MPKTSTENSNEKSKASKLPGVFKTLSPNVHLLHLSVLRQLNNKRAGTASTKTKAEVRGGGKKPWKQKGTGRARAGSIRSPLWVGGGITFGPKPRSFRSELPKKARNLAIAQSLISKEENLEIIKKLPEIKEAKTKEFKAAINSITTLKFPVLFIADSSDLGLEKVKRAASNLPDVVVKDQQFVGPFDILKASSVFITEKALTEMEKRFSKALSSKKGLKVTK